MWCTCTYAHACLSVPDAEAAIKGLEVSPQAMASAGHLANRVSAKGGAALLIDYGRNRPYPASLQAIKQHKFCGLLEQPGLADLSAHVDFGAIRYMIELWSRCFLACIALEIHCPLNCSLCVLLLSALLSAHYNDVCIGDGHIWNAAIVRSVPSSQKGMVETRFVKQTYL